MSYTTSQVCEKLDIKRERLREWLLKDFINASINQASGVGTKNLFSDIDIIGIRLFKYLIETIKINRITASVMIKKWFIELNTVYNSITTSNISLLELAKTSCVIFEFDNSNIKCNIPITSTLLGHINDPNFIHINMDKI
jgi:hypothetical protein